MRNDPYQQPTGVRPASTGSELDREPVPSRPHTMHQGAVEQAIWEQRSSTVAGHAGSSPELREALVAAGSDLTRFDIKAATSSQAEEALKAMSAITIHGRHESDFSAPPLAQQVLGYHVQGRKLALFVSDARGTVSSEEFGALLSSVQDAVGARAAGEYGLIDSYRSGSVVCAPRADGDLPTTVYVFQNADHARAAYARRVATADGQSAQEES